MTTNLDIEKPEAPDLSEQTKETSETRRRLLRAGLAVAPVLMAVQSRSVLACGGSYGGGGGGGTKQRVTCSAFASLKAANFKLSHSPTTTNYPCKSHEDWKKCDHPYPYAKKQNCYFHDKSYKSSRSSWGGCNSFGGDPHYSTAYFSYGKRLGCNYAGFKASGNTYPYGDKTLQEMLYCNDPLARHVVATILNKCNSSYDPDNILPSPSQCFVIYQNNGAWTPPNCTTAWSRADTLAWFDSIYGTCS